MPAYVIQLVALASRHLRDVAHRKDQQLALVADGRDERVRGRHQRRRQDMGILRHVSTVLPARRSVTRSLKSRRESVARVGGEQPQIFRLAEHDSRERRAIGGIEAPRERLTLAARRGQGVRGQRVGASGAVDEHRVLQAAAAGSARKASPAL